ncbi:MAG TPA: ubiquinol-cytochrome c reductase iron-sulfur subunit [Plantibacter sp.]|uniref:QcrA and Rieske domain-containing protein n=1 Tax=Plantibacter sp. TaxID=1871045 RepID=UPI002BAE15FE|nr:ubiquinol-cytochrome c reductase iron-sulfur subunit [Plantibacter sp.]
MNRRRALTLFVNTTVALIGGGLTAVLGAFAFRPSRGADTARWVRAGAVADLEPHVPVPRVLSISRQDGWYRQRARETVFLVWDGDTTVHALSATCTHLGCQVRWDADSTTFRCPCHGGVFGPDGAVVEGPPSRPLDRVDARIESAGAAGADVMTVMVRL